MSKISLVRCPRCGSTKAGSVGEVGIELDVMACRACSFREICDSYEIKFDWNESVEVADAQAPHVVPPVVLPRTRFLAMMKLLGVTDELSPLASQALNALRAHYSEAHRAYHNAEHISACLRLLDAHAGLAQHPAEVECALWFHDVIYDTHAQDNEDKSAVLLGTLLDDLGVSSEVRERVQAHIRATQRHDAETADGQLVLDIDLSILGTDEATYSIFELAIRQEYSWVPLELYRATRKGVLQRFRQREVIYRTPAFFERFERNARENLARALGNLA
jgi:predicted metal-dependent HD superfamily phosphohydrolase